MLGLPPAQLSVLTDNLLLASNGAVTAATAAASAATGSTTGAPVTPATASAGNTGNALAPLLPQRVGQLVWLGLSPATLAALRPYITLLPVRTPLNLNTASAEVLYASIPGIEHGRCASAGDAARSHALRHAGRRRRSCWARRPAHLNADQHGVGSRFFEVRGRLRLDQTVVQERSLVQRDGLDVQRAVARARRPPALPGQPAPAN